MLFYARNKYDRYNDAVFFHRWSYYYDIIETESCHDANSVVTGFRFQNDNRQWRHCWNYDLGFHWYRYASSTEMSLGTIMLENLCCTFSIGWNIQRCNALNIWYKWVNKCIHDKNTEIETKTVLLLWFVRVYQTHITASMFVISNVYNSFSSYQIQLTIICDNMICIVLT